jgi:hypothetical protein
MLKGSKINIFTLAILSMGIFFIAETARAQTPQQIISGIENNIQVSITPEFPKAGDSVAIHLVSYSTPLDQATISYIVGGKVINKGLGLVDFNTTAGAIGSISTITARILTANGQTVNKIITIQPADIDLVWQAESYTPPFYQGKALYPHQGLITFVAIPNTSASKSVAKSLGSFIYTWKKDGDILGDFSGYGKNTFNWRGTVISRPFNVEVDVSTSAGISIGSANVNINPQSPVVALYQDDPLLGVLANKNLKNITMIGKELSIAAVPYFFNKGTEPVNLEYKWTMNGQSIANQLDPSILTVRNNTGLSGNSTIGLQVSNVLKILQFASDSMSVTFGQDKQTSI